MVPWGPDGRVVIDHKGLWGNFREQWKWSMIWVWWWLYICMCLSKSIKWIHFIVLNYTSIKFISEVKNKKSQFTKWWVYQTYNLSTRSSTEAPFTWCLGSSNTSQAVLTVGAHSSHNFQAPSGSLAEFLWTFSGLFQLFSGWKGHICEAASPRGQMCSRLSSRDSLTITPAVRWWRWGHTIP